MIFALFFFAFIIGISPGCLRHRQRETVWAPFHANSPSRLWVFFPSSSLRPFLFAHYFRLRQYSSRRKSPVAVFFFPRLSQITALPIEREGLSTSTGVLTRVFLTQEGAAPPLSSFTAETSDVIDVDLFSGLNGVSNLIIKFEWWIGRNVVDRVRLLVQTLT